MVCSTFQSIYNYVIEFNGIEYAEYTSAQERIALGKKSKKIAASKQREEKQELIADA